jgi:DNA-3-methyladenine glycosylase II
VSARSTPGPAQAHDRPAEAGGGRRPGAGVAAAVSAESDNPAVEHLRAADPVMRALVEAHGPLTLEERRRGRPADPYGALVRSIVGQQLSTKAARSIYGRLLELFGGRTPAPDELLAIDPELIRSAGLSRPKVAYLRDLAARVEDGELAVDRLAELDDEGVVAALTAVRGLGRWTAEMFLIFHLGRPDVLPVGDLGIRRAVERAYGLPHPPEPPALEEIAGPWRPHRTLACLYLWRSLDNAP